ncbi:MAG: PilZ domain-containing protein [Deltaproteobacteria bacterium]|nr:PilZ domain-containing protein [Deltaproteobacteria bacterium]
MPIPELPGEIPFVPEVPGLTVQLLVISLGGLKVWVQRGRVELVAGDEQKLELRLGKATVEVTAVVRHVSADQSMQGLEFVEPSDEARKALNRYVTELKMRGASA